MTALIKAILLLSQQKSHALQVNDVSLRSSYMQREDSGNFFQQELSTGCCIKKLARLVRLRLVKGIFRGYSTDLSLKKSEQKLLGSLRRASAYQITSAALGRRTPLPSHRNQIRLSCTRSSVLFAFSRH